MPGGRPAKYGSDDERRAADAERKRLARERLVDPELPARDINEEPVTHPSIERVIAEATPGALSEEEEQTLRDHFGYSKSEKRTKAERDATAARILGRPSGGGIVTLEQYVKQTRWEALQYSIAIGETDAPWQIPGTKETIENRRIDRLDRAERYARWRYAGFLSGEVASL